MKWCGGRGREGGKSVRWRGSRDGHYLHERRIDWPRSPSRTRKRSELLFLCLRLHLCAPRSWLIRSRSAYVMYLRINSVNAHRAALGIEPRTSRTLSENHTTRPSSQLTVVNVCLKRGHVASTLWRQNEGDVGRGVSLHTFQSVCLHGDGYWVRQRDDPQLSVTRVAVRSLREGETLADFLGPLGPLQQLSANRVVFLISRSVFSFFFLPPDTCPRY